MNEENKNNGILGEDSAPEVNEEKVLNEELETLRETFQEKYDETVEEANALPVIQELEEGEEEEEAEEEEEEEIRPAVEKASKTKKKKKAGKKIAIAIPVVLLLLVVGSLVAYVAASIANPNISSFMSAYAQASASTDYAEKIEHLENALEFCTDKESSFQQAMAATIMEEIAVAIYEEEGFAAAYSYMKSDMSEEQIKNPVSSKFRKIAKIADSVNALSLEAFAKTYENLGDLTQVPEADVLLKGFNVPDGLEKEFGEALIAIAEGYIHNKEHNTLEGTLEAMNYYASGYSALVSFGADSRALAEKMVVDVYNNGFIVEAAALAAVAVDPSKDDVNADFTAFKAEIAKYAETGISVIALAEKAVVEEKTSAEDILAAVKAETELSDVQADVIAKITAYAVSALAAENEKNFTKASTLYSTLISVLEAFGMDDVAAYIKTANAIFETGNLNDVSTLITTYLTEEMMEEATDEQKVALERINNVVAALSATSEVFSPYYAEYYQYGTAIDIAALEAELDEMLVGIDGNEAYMKGFVNYCLYIAAVSTGDTTEGSKYLVEMERLMPDLPFIYGYSFIAEYLEDCNFEKAYAYAQKLLSVNIADEYANSVLALYERVNGNLDKAEEIALKGIELSGTDSADCAYQLTIIYMLKGDFESAFNYLSTVFSVNQAMDSYELVLIFNALYDGDNEDLKTTLAEMVDAVKQTYEYYGVSSYAETTAVIEGTKTIEEVYMSGDCMLTAG